MSSNNSEDMSGENTFDWNKYLAIRNAEEVPEDFFYHVCKSEQNGIELGSVVEVENEDQNGYWFASVCSSKGVLINLHYFGDENDKQDFWVEVKSPRIHPLNWGSENNKKLIPPYPDRFSRANPNVIKEKVQDCENIISNSVLQMKGAPIHNIFKSEMFVEIQDKEYPYRVWISKILKNVGGRLFLKIQGETCPEKEPFWLFYLNERVFPLGWAEQKGLPWRVMNLDVNIEGAIDSSLLLNVLKPKTPEQHSYKVGEMLEVINPYSLMVFYVASIVKIYDNRYFKVEVNNDCDIEKRITFVATKENPYIFNAGWASKHKFLLKPPSDWDSSNNFCWSKYVSMNDFKLAHVDNTCRKKIDRIHKGMKLEAVDPVDPDCIRVATIQGFTDHWMFLSFDRTSWCQKLIHVRSVYSDDVFPVGWCSKHKYSLSTPKYPYINNNDFDNYYYASDVELKEENLIKYPQYFKGEIFYHYSKNGSHCFENKLGESIKNNVVNDNCVPSSDVSKTKKNNKDDIKSVIKLEQPELDEEFHDALFSEEEVNTLKKENVDFTKKEKIDNVKHLKELDTNNEDANSREKNMDETLCPNKLKLSVYFNKSCYPGSGMIKKKVDRLPNSIGPGPVTKILQEAITTFVNLDYFPSIALKKIKKNQQMLFNGPGGVSKLITSKSRSNYSEHLLLPKCIKLAQEYCSTLCKLSAMCPYFMSTEKSECLNGCNKKGNKTSTLKPEIKTFQINRENTKRNTDSTVLTSSECTYKRLKLNEEIAKIAKEELDWTNKPLVERYKYYMGCITNYEIHIRRLDQSFTQLELAILGEIQLKKNHLRILDGINNYSNTRSDLDKIEEEEFCFIKDWKSSFEKYYRLNPRLKKFKIDIGYIEYIKITSNPKYWSPEDVNKYLSNDPFCDGIRKTFIQEQVDGVAFMLLNEEQLLRYLRVSINLAIRIMCHIAEVKYIFLTEYCK